ncbi:PAS domain-containing protein [Rickettsiella endosymbiont of Dermanyssus gallinae]|uniref:PAS domain-containing protein n=1 Tax=Rickettsiella endosymbiont of Dermanyssus gallinae TaxID=2856608 RepID=UPI001C52C619|nr:PAS domain-containing protein [Rickettsiella endosymbiont of Dermanyssus gallinae]
MTKKSETTENIDKVLNKALDLFNSHIYWKDIHGKYVWCNKKYLSVLGLKDQAKIKGKTDYDLYDSKLAKTVGELDKKVFNTAEEYQAEEIGFDENGEQAYYLSIKTPLKGETGIVEGLLGLSINITKQKKLEKSLKKAKEKAEAANQAKTEFLENMRHDMRTPLSGIVGCAHLIKMQSDLPTKVTAFADGLVQSSEALLEFLNKILESITVGSGEIPVLKNRFNLKEAL